MKHLKRTIAQAVSWRTLTLMRKFSYLTIDLANMMLGRQIELVPPRNLRFLIGGDGTDFNELGEEFLQYFIEFAGLRPDETVLDVGCGVGRMALPLTRYLSHSASYEGFDIMKGGIQWCQRNISSRYPHFRFQRADIYNARYNPHGKYRASDYRFPYHDAVFDFVFLTSVFTHMLPKAVERYLVEIERVLKRGGRCLITFFLLNAESLALIDAGLSRYNFRFEDTHCRTEDKETPEVAVAYDETLIRQFYEKHGLRIEEPVRYGSWCGRKEFTSYQDIMVATKPVSMPRPECSRESTGDAVTRSPE